MSNIATGYNNYDYEQHEGFRLYSGWNDMFAGSGLAGELPESITYDMVVEKLGEPKEINGVNIDKRWHLIFPKLNDKDKNYAATIYTMFGDNRKLYVGGFRGEIVDRVKEIFNV